MKQRQFSAGTGAVILALAVMLIGRPAPAGTRTPVTFIGTIVSRTLESFRVSGHIAHGTQLETGFVTGDIEGTVTILADFHFDINTELGGARATVTLVTIDGVIFEGTYELPNPHTFNGRFRAHGSDGSKLQGTISGQPDGTFLNEGILITH
jgi:hypothetical protein